jgi:hypothetical protein
VEFCLQFKIWANFAKPQNWLDRARYSDPDHGLLCPAGRRAGSAARAPCRHAAACRPCHRATWTPATPAPRPLERPRGRPRAHSLRRPKASEKLHHPLPSTRNPSDQFEFSNTFAISLRTQCTPRNPPCPSQSPGRRLSSSAPAESAAVGASRGHASTDRLWPSRGNHRVCVSPGELPRCSTAADEHPNVETAISGELLCFQFAARDFARQFEVLQGSNCRDCDSGE